MPKVLVQNEALQVEVDQNANLRKALKAHKINVYDNLITTFVNCGGHGKCGTCKVMVINGRDNCAEPTNAEKKKLGDEDLAAGFRLSCQCAVKGDIEVHCHP